MKIPLGLEKKNGRLESIFFIRFFSCLSSSHIKNLRAASHISHREYHFPPNTSQPFVSGSVAQSSTSLTNLSLGWKCQFNSSLTFQTCQLKSLQVFEDSETSTWNVSKQKRIMIKEAVARIEHKYFRVQIDHSPARIRS